MKTHLGAAPQGGPGATRSRALLAAIGSLMLAIPSAARAADEPAARGQWMLEWRDDKERVQMNFTWRRPDGSGQWRGDEIPLARLDGLTAEQLDARPSAVRFEIRRDAGTFTCEGRAGDGAGAGLYELRLDPAFAGLRRRGVGAPSETQQIRLAFAAAGYALLDELKAQKHPTPTIAQLVQMGDHGVDREYVSGMARLGVRAESLAELVKARDHGVTPGYIIGLRDAGFTGLTLAEITTARDHGVTPRYLTEMREFGHGGLSLAEYIRLRDHGVDGDYIRAMAEAGHGELPLSVLTRSRDHGVDARYVREMAEAGYKDLPLGELVRSRDHGVDPRYIREMDGAGYKDLSLDEMIRARNHGVDAKFARRVKNRLGKTVSLERLITIRNRGEMD
ncbi:MAG: hypothetical protein ACRENJ_08930 [Candidatus Eiseniibacteriota bacterium]